MLKKDEVCQRQWAEMTDELFLLGLLWGAAMHGYGLNEMAAEIRPFGWHMRPSSVYGRLERLERDGLVESRTERAGRRPERRIYALTAAGQDRFRELLRENLGSGERVAAPGELGLLFQGVLSPDEVGILLAERREAMAESRAGIEELARRNLPGRLALEYALAMTEAEVAWLDETIERAASGDL